MNLEEVKIKAIKQIHKRKVVRLAEWTKLLSKGSKGKKVSINKILIQI